MLHKISYAIRVLVFGLICIGFAFAQTNPAITGQWTLGGFIIQEQVQLTVQRGSIGSSSSMSSSSPIAISQLRGLTRAQLDSAGSMVRFEVVRDAGTLQLQGYVQNGSGGGTFTFLPNSGFAEEMRAMGYTVPTNEKMFALAMHDVSAVYVRGLIAAGTRADSVDQLITMRIHNVAVEYVNELRSLGYSDLTPQKLVTMRIHDVTTGFARDLKDRGYTVSPDQMVTMRIHDVSVDFIRDLEALGYNHPSINQLVTMRIHSVTPDYIRKTRARGLGDLSIEDLVRLKIHGIVD